MMKTKFRNMREFYIALMMCGLVLLIFNGCDRDVDPANYQE